jgi:polyphosphate:AMP phosphotransferase
MFEAAEVGAKIDKATFKKEEPKIRSALLDMQRRLKESKCSVVILVGGVEGAGKSETVNLLHEWMDARGLETHAMWDPSDEELERPPMWRFWRVLPPKGKMGIFFGSWYSAPIVNRVFGTSTQDALDATLERIVEFERMLTHEGVIVLKFWMHMSKKAQKKRLHELADDPETAWRVSKRDFKFFKKYDDFRTVSEHALRKTNTAEAPWHIVEAADDRHRSLTVTRTILETVNERLDAAEAAAKVKWTPEKPPVPSKNNVLVALDLTKKLSEAEYERKLAKMQGKLNQITRGLHEKKRSVILVFEGPDAAGKGGAIRRITGAMDSRIYQVISIAAPTDEERARPYLWRFWRQIPRKGNVTIYDRSWYGRVLVERVENFTAPEHWKRAYEEINGFEDQLVDYGIVLVKFYLQIGAEEQLRRFRERENIKYKQYKITEEDWRNRKKWNPYLAAAAEMLEKTSTEMAPWVLAEANDKRWARFKVLKTVVDQLEKRL